MNNSIQYSNSQKSTRVLLSIKPEYASAIFSGKKWYEFRRIKFSRSVDVVVIYVTSPISRVVAEFDIEEIISKPILELWEYTWEHAGVDEECFFQYFNGKEIGHALKIGEVRHYKFPYHPVDKLGINPPQSFVYL